MLPWSWDIKKVPQDPGVKSDPLNIAGLRDFSLISHLELSKQKEKYSSGDTDGSWSKTSIIAKHWVRSVNLFNPSGHRLGF